MGKVYLGNQQLGTNVGKLYYGNVEIIGSGGGDTDDKFEVTVLDYDGTILDQVKLDDGATYTLPAAPTHTGLTFIDWSCSETITNNTITINGNDVMIGANYTTTSGVSEFDIEVTATSLSIYGYAFNGDTFNWGDGTSDTASSNGYITHTYAQAGEYTITYNGVKIYGYGSNSATYQYYGFLSGNNNGSRTKINLKRVRLSNIVTSFSSGYAFNTSDTLQYIMLSTNITQIPDGLFGNNDSFAMTHLIVPNSITQISNSYGLIMRGIRYVVIPKKAMNIYSSSFNSNALKKIVIPASNIKFYSSQNISSSFLIEKIILNNIWVNSTSFLGSCYNLKKAIIKNSTFSSEPTQMFSQCFSLKEVQLINNTGNLGSSAFDNCISLEKIKMPKTQTYYYDSFFKNCVSLIEYDFTEYESVPTLSSTGVFLNINPNCKMYVPDSLYNDWKAASNWSAFANYIYKASERV